MTAHGLVPEVPAREAEAVAAAAEHRSGVRVGDAQRPPAVRTGTPAQTPVTLQAAQTRPLRQVHGGQGGEEGATEGQPPRSDGIGWVG